jgi:hypothetical protein
MMIAKQKRKENIVEYILYMWQVEDLIRACRFGSEEIERRIISQYEQPEEVKAEIRKWYDEIIEMMRMEGIMEHGHIQIVKNTVSQLVELHLSLLKSPQETIYGSLYYKALASIVQLRSKSGNEDISEIETCLTALYGYLLLKMQGKEISNETVESLKTISRFLTFLAGKFYDEENNQAIS